MIERALLIALLCGGLIAGVSHLSKHNPLAELASCKDWSSQACKAAKR